MVGRPPLLLTAALLAAAGFFAASSSSRSTAGALQQGRSLGEQAPAPAPPTAGSTVLWSVLRASHGGSVRASSTNSSLLFISVPGAVLLGTTVATSHQPSEEACAAACAAAPTSAMYNYCPPSAVGGRCEMDTALSIEKPGACYLLSISAEPSVSIMPLLGNGSDIGTVAGAPLDAPLLAVPQPPGYSSAGHLGFTLFGSGNYHCDGSFQDFDCALAGSAADLAAACNASASCSAFYFLSSAAPLLASGQGSSTAGILKSLSSPLEPHHMTYSPFGATFLRPERVALAPPAPPDPPTTMPGSSRHASWSVLMRPQAELHTLPDGGVVIRAPHILLPGTQVSALTLEPTYDDCVTRCTTHPDCKSVLWCPADRASPCTIGTIAVPSLPPGSCSLLWEASVANVNSVAVLAQGLGMHVTAGVPVTARANVSLPGYRQHLGQALLGAYDLTSEWCPDSLRPDHCRLVGSLQYAADRCRVHPNCTGFTWREQPKPELTNSSSAVLKGCGPQGFDPRRVNWNPGLSLFVKEGVPLEPAPPLPSEPVEQGQAPADDMASSGVEIVTLSPGGVAGIVVGCAAAAALSGAAAFAVWRRRRQRRRSAGAASTTPSVLQMLPAALSPAAGQLKAKTSLPTELPELSDLQIEAGGPAEPGGSTVVQASSKSTAVSSPRRRGPGISPGRPNLPLVPAAVGMPGSASSGQPRLPPASVSPGDPSLPASPAGGSPDWLSLSASRAGDSFGRPNLPAAPNCTQPSQGCASSGGRGDLADEGDELEEGNQGGSSSSGSSSSGSSGRASGSSLFGRNAGTEGLVAQLLGQVGAEALRDMLVPQEAVTYARGTDGRPVVLGQGGFGAVYKVMLREHTLCAAKVLEWAGRGHLQAMFIQEAAMMRRLNHPNLVQFMGICMCPESGMLIMEHCAKDLEAVMDMRRASGQRVLHWANRGRRVAMDIAAGLVYLHSCNVLHLDLKPSNILLTRDWLAKIGDVGLARLCSRTRLSVASVGTFEYCAPEILLARGACAASDIFSLGMVLYQLITGERPRRGRLRPLRWPDECPRAVADLQEWCMVDDPAQRPTAAQVLQALREAEQQLSRARTLPAALPPLPPSPPPARAASDLPPTSPPEKQGSGQLIMPRL